MRTSRSGKYFNNLAISHAFSSAHAVDTAVARGCLAYLEVKSHRVGQVVKAAMSTL